MRGVGGCGCVVWWWWFVVMLGDRRLCARKWWLWHPGSSRRQATRRSYHMDPGLEATTNEKSPSQGSDISQIVQDILDGFKYSSVQVVQRSYVIINSGHYTDSSEARI